MKSSLNRRIDLDFVGLGNAGIGYGGHLHAWSFRDIDGEEWFSEFRETSLDAIGTRFLPIYRMADGEYRFLMGRKFNSARRPLIREIAAIAAERLRIKNPDKWKTSWGEEYSPEMTRGLRAELIDSIRYISRYGYLACYVNDNGLNAFTEYNQALESYFEAQDITFGSENYVPFHFAPSLFIASGWRAFIERRSILIVTGIIPEKEKRIRATLEAMGAARVQFLPISLSASMTDRIDLSSNIEHVDVCLVAAGIGSANILRQLAPLQTLSVDIGGLMNCLVDPNIRQHGGVIGLPQF